MDQDAVDRIRKALEKREKESGKFDEKGRAFLQRAEEAVRKKEAGGKMDWPAVDRIKKALDDKEKKDGKRDEEGHAFYQRAEEAARKNEREGKIPPKQN